MTNIDEAMCSRCVKRVVEAEEAAAVFTAEGRRASIHPERNSGAITVWIVTPERYLSALWDRRICSISRGYAQVVRASSYASGLRRADQACGQKQAPEGGKI
jgi:hypothetical protein